MVSGMTALAVAHVICTTLGYGALISSNVALALMAHRRDPTCWKARRNQR